MTLVDPRFYLAHAPVGDVLVLGYALLVVEGFIDELVDVACDQISVFRHKVEPRSDYQWHYTSDCFSSSLGKRLSA